MVKRKTGDLQCEATHLKGQLTIKLLIQKRLKPNRNPSMLVHFGIPALKKLRQEGHQILSQPGQKTLSQKRQNQSNKTQAADLCGRAAASSQCPLLREVLLRDISFDKKLLDDRKNSSDAPEEYTKLFPGT